VTTLESHNGTVLGLTDSLIEAKRFLPPTVLG
jgi:hypothetical protein